MKSTYSQPQKNEQTNKRTYKQMGRLQTNKQTNKQTDEQAKTINHRIYNRRIHESHNIKQITSHFQEKRLQKQFALKFEPFLHKK